MSTEHTQPFRPFFFEFVLVVIDRRIQLRAGTYSLLALMSARDSRYRKTRWAVATREAAMHGRRHALSDSRTVEFCLNLALELTNILVIGALRHRSRGEKLCIDI